jgi:zinc protease
VSTVSSPAEPQTPRPEVVPPGDWAFPLPAESQTSNGLRVLAYDLPGQYVLSVRVVVPFDLVEEPAGKEGVAVMTARLLDEGTARHSAEEFAALLERAGVAFGAGVSDGGLLVDLEVPQRFLPTALGLLREALAEPAFPDTEVRRILRSRLAEIEQERASAPHRAGKELITTLYAASARASRPAAGTAASIASLTREDLAEFHRRHIGPAGATVVVAGDLTGIDVEGALESTLGQWTAPDQEPAARPSVPAAAPDRVRVVVVDRPGSVQSELAVACPGPDRSVGGGWAAYPVLSFLVGGSPSARVDAVLREDKGYTYGIRSTFRPRTRGGMFVSSGSVRVEVTAEALDLLVGILRRVREGFTEDEVRAGVDFVSRTAAGRYATADAVADEAGALALEGLPLSFTTDNLTRTKSLTGADLSAAYASVVDDAWTIIVVTDAAQTVEAIRGLGLGDVTVVQA